MRTNGRGGQRRDGEKWEMGGREGDEMRRIGRNEDEWERWEE